MEQSSVENESVSKEKKSRPNTEIILEEYLYEARKLLLSEGLDARFTYGLVEWCEVMATAEGSVGVNPTFDCRTQTIPFEDSFAFFLCDGEGTIGCMACRLFETSSYYDLIRSGRVWYNEPDFDPIQLIKPGRGPSGRVSHTGGLWIHPSRRGTGLSWILPRMVSAAAVAAWRIDWHTGMVFADLNRTDISTKNYGSARNLPIIDGYFPPTKRKERIYSNETTGSDILERTDRDLRQIRSHRNKKVRDFAPLTKKGKNQAPISANSTAEVTV